MNRRNVLKQLSLGTGAAAFSPFATAFTASDEEPWLKLAVQQYSFNRQLKSGELELLDYPKTVVDGTGIKALEYYNGHIEGKAGKTGFFKALRQRTDDLGAVNTMMLCRSKNALDSPDGAERSGLPPSRNTDHGWKR